MDWRAPVRRLVGELDLEPWREEEIVEELAQDLEERWREARARGASDEEARSFALAELDDPALTAALAGTERRRAPVVAPGRPPAAVPHRRAGPLDGFRHDLRCAVRGLLRSPGFALVVLATLALGIGVNTAILGVAEAVLARPLPYRDPGRLVHFFETKPGEDFSRREASYPDFEDWAARSDLFEAVAGYDGGSVTLVTDSGPERVQALQVTDGFFSMLGVEAAHGRLFAPGERGAGGGALAVLTWSAWQRRFGGDPAAVGRPLVLDEDPYTIVGVLPRDVSFPLRGDAEIWLLLEVEDRRREARSWHWLDAIGRLRDGIDREQAEAGLAATAAHIAEVDPRWHDGHGITLVPLRDEMVGNVRGAVVALVVTAVFVLLIVCSNIANLLLVRSAGRGRELALRAALGADRGRLVRQLLTEGLLLALLGGLGGLLVARAATGLLLGHLPARWLARLPHLETFTLDGRTLLLAFGLAGLTGLVFTLAPVLRVGRQDLAAAFQRGRGAGSEDRGRLRRAFVVSEIALSFVLLIAAGLVTRSFVELMRVSPGFAIEGLTTARLSLPSTRYRDDGELRAFHRRLLEEVGAVGGVEGVATVSQLPLTGRGNTGGFKVRGRPAGERTEVNIRTVSTSYFEVLGVPLRQGRRFGPGDRADSPLVVLVNETLARRVFAGRAVGERISFNFFEGEPWWEIVGVVADERVGSLDQDVTPVLYFPYSQTPDRSASLLVRAAVAPAVLSRQLLATVQELDPQLPLYEIGTLREIVDDSAPVFLRRYLTWLIGGFSALAAFLAVLGLYGVTAYSVMERRREIGVRMALGADPRRILAMVMAQGARLAAVGVALGLATSIALRRLLASLLFGIDGADLLVHAGVAGLLAVAVLAACAVPAGRAARIDPAVALDSE